jgi:hypothetical protein
MSESLLRQVEKLRERFPVSDPLEILYIWGIDVREKVAKSLAPYIVIEAWSGEIRWLLDLPKASRMADTIRILAFATVWEKTGHQKHFALTEKQAEYLADYILRTNAAAPAAGG